MIRFLLFLLSISSSFAKTINQSAQDINAGIDTVTNSATKLINALGSFLVDGKNTYDKTENTLNNTDELKKIQDINELREKCNQSLEEAKNTSQAEMQKLNDKINNIANQVRTWLNEDLSKQNEIITETNKEIENLNTESSATNDPTAQNYILRELVAAQQELSEQTNRFNVLKQRLEQLEYSLQLNNDVQIQQYLGLVNQGRQAAGLSARTQVTYAQPYPQSYNQQVTPAQNYIPQQQQFIPAQAQNQQQKAIKQVQYQDNNYHFRVIK